MKIFDFDVEMLGSLAERGAFLTAKIGWVTRTELPPMYNDAPWSDVTLAGGFTYIS